MTTPADGGGQVVEKRKLSIEVRILSAHVKVSEPQDLKVEWTRNGKNISTKKVTVDGQTTEPKFKDRFSMGSNFKFDNSTSTYLPDMSELTLYCEGNKVGTCMLNLVSYIDRKPAVEKVTIAP